MLVIFVIIVLVHCAMSSTKFSIAAKLVEDNIIGVRRRQKEFILLTVVLRLVVRAIRLPDADEESTRDPEAGADFERVLEVARRSRDGRGGDGEFEEFCDGVNHSVDFDGVRTQQDLEEGVDADDADHGDCAETAGLILGEVIRESNAARNRH